MGLLSACTNQKEIGIEYQVSITIDPSSVIDAFNGISVNNKKYGLDMDEGCTLLITSLLYDETGSLVEKQIFDVVDYSSIVQYNILMAEGREYTHVAITYSIDGSYDEPIPSYILENESSLDKLSIQSEFPNGNSYYSNWSMLGLSTEKITTVSKEYVVKVQPASSLIELDFKNIHAWDDAGIDKHYLAYTNNDKVLYGSNGFLYASSASVNAGYSYSLDITDNDSNNIFVILHLLPTDNMFLWGGYVIGEQSATYGSYLDNLGLDPSIAETSITIEAGREYLFKVDCSDFIVEASAFTKGTEDDSINEVYETRNNYVVLGVEQSVNVVDLFNRIKE